MFGKNNKSKHALIILQELIYFYFNIFKNRKDEGLNYVLLLFIFKRKIKNMLNNYMTRSRVKICSIISRMTLSSLSTIFPCSRCIVTIK